jgi:hypothetical protein
MTPMNTDAEARPSAQRAMNPRTFMNQLFRILLLFPLFALASYGAELTPEQEHLNQYAGEWEGTLTTLPDARVRIICEWILDGTFLRHSITVTPSPGAQPVGVLQLTGRLFLPTR